MKYAAKEWKFILDLVPIILTRFRTRFPEKVRNISFVQLFPTGSATQPASYGADICWFFLRGSIARGVKWLSNFHVVPSLRTGGGTSLLPLYALNGSA